MPDSTILKKVVRKNIAPKLISSKETSLLVLTNANIYHYKNIEI